MSSISGVKAKLAEVWRDALPDSLVINGPITSVTATKPRLLTIGRAMGTIDFDSFGGASTGEEYTVEFAVSVDWVGTDQDDVIAAAVADFTAAVSAIQTHPSGPTLGLEAQGVLSVFPTGEFEQEDLADPNGRHSVVRSSVAVRAHNI